MYIDATIWIQKFTRLYDHKFWEVGHMRMHYLKALLGIYTVQQKASIWMIACICLNIHALYENLTLWISWDIKTNYSDNFILKYLLCDYLLLSCILQENLPITKVFNKKMIDRFLCCFVAYAQWIEIFTKRKKKKNVNYQNT